MKCGDWNVSTLKKEGMSESRINELIDFIKKENKTIHSIVVIKSGNIVKDISFNGYSSEDRHAIYSCSKSITSALIGKSIQQGFIKDVSQKVLDFFPEITLREENRRLENMSIEDLLIMATGLEWNDMKNYNEMWDSDNWVEYFFSRPVQCLPGTKFTYCSGVAHILQFIIEKVTGEEVFSYAKRVLFEPLGISNVLWDKESNGMLGSIEMTPLDMAKVGYMYLNKGIWKGEKIIPEHWVTISTSKHIDTPNNLNEITNFGAGYGYLWWNNYFGGYHANGFGGQYMFVVPESDIVVVFTGEVFGQDFFMPQLAMEKYII
ncbi:serine hydrolase [Clostridium sp. P21]|uniref:Serine hydrolase n=1 Tax=Clostridium muellerianum TaxID=2716538 RepID=A0A7Y0HPU0_9CLOT|nr:serine hydrolase [Clostridium muellerianum]NMM63048.1 serine hydrolase [Clostridium muellerianum]